MKEHILKTLPDYWDAVECGDKTFELRRDDREFQKGDILILKRLPEEEIINDGHTYLIPTLERKIIYILNGGQFGIEPGYVVLALGK